MAPAATALPQLPKAVKQHLPVSSVSGSRQSSLRLSENEASRSTSTYQRRISMKKSVSNMDTSALGQVIYTLKRRSSTELGSQTSATLLDSTRDSILDWIRVQRMNLLPNEGSSYDRVLSWAQVLIERLYSLEMAIDDFSGDGHVAAQLAYGYCDVLLRLGPEHAEALKLAFGLCQTVSAPLANLADRVEQFQASEDVCQQLVTSLSSLVTLVAGVATYFHRAINESSTITITDNLYGHFQSEIRAFSQCYEKTVESIWKHQLSFNNQSIQELDQQTQQLHTIKKWLAPEDPMIGHVMDDLPCLANAREELSCLWIGPHLARFMRGHMQTLSLYGVAGSGKTMLSSVLVDYLQNPLGRMKYDTLYMSIDRAAPTETTLGEVAKTLLAQLFEKRIGDVELFDILTTACETSRSTTEVSAYDNLTWDALERALSYTRPSARELVLVVDGIDAAYGGEESLMNRLVAATAKATNVKLITLGAEKRQQPGSLETNVRITEDVVFDDVVAVTRRHLSRRVSYFSSMTPMDQETVASRIAGASGGSFIWAKLAVESLRGEKSAEDLVRVSDGMSDSKSVTIQSLVQQTLLGSEMKKDTKLALVWLSRARRPLSLREFGTLLAIQPEQNKLRSKQPDVMAIIEPISHLVSFRHGTVSLSHDSTRNAVLDILSQGKWLSNFGDGHKEFVTRLLSYTKMTLAQHHQQHPDPSLSLMSDSEIRQLVGRFPLLDYAARHWPAHLMSNTSILTNHDECVNVAKSMASVFPEIPSALVLQSTLWQKTVPTVTMLPYQTVVYNMCSQLFTAEHPTTIQAMINLSILYREISMETRSIDLLYHVITTSQTLLSPRHPLTLQVSQLFLEVTDESAVFLEKRETVLLLMVECYKAQHGHTSEMVVMTLNLLVDHYKLVGSETKVQETIERIRTTTETEYGTYDGDHRYKIAPTKQPSVPEGGMRLDLDILERDETLQATSSYESFDVELWLREADNLAEKKSKRAEQRYLETWQRATKVSQTHRSDIWEERKLQAGLAYSKFLKKQNKTEAASSVLSSIWEEYSQTQTTTLTEKLSQKLTEVASCMRSVGLQSEALSLLKQCSSYYESRHSTQSSFYQEIQQTIEVSSKELMESLSNSSSTSKSWTATSEATLEQTVLDSCKAITTTESATTAVQAVWSLTDRYTANRRWQAVSTFLNKVLFIIWPALLSPTMQELSLPKPALENLLESCVDLVERLCESFHVRRQMTGEEDIRVRLYRSLRSGRPVEDPLRKRVTSRLLSLFKTTSQKDAAIQVQRELLNDLTTFYGPEHPTVLQSLWDTAELVRPRPMFVEYYQQIVRILNKDNQTTCVPAAFEPVSVIAFQLWGRGQTFDALPYYRTLFETFIENPGLNPKLQDHTFVHEMFDRYTSCLRADSTNLTVLHQVTTRYRQQCMSVFGAQTSISIKATLTLAGICQESKHHISEAIDLYNELLVSGSNEVNREEIKTIIEATHEQQAALAHDEYSASSSKSTRSYTEKSVKMMTQRFEEVRQSGSWSQEESLTMLTEMVRYKISQNETHEVVTHLREATTNVLLTETNSSRLVQAASTIAFNFVAADQVQEARQLRQELYTQMVLKTAAQTETTITGTETLTNLSMEKLIFLAEFECSLRHTGATVSEVLATLITEYTHLSEFRSLTASGSSATLRSVLLSTARLDRILRENHQQEDIVFSVMFEHLNRFFIETEGRAVSLTEPKQVDILLKTLIRHVETHECTDVARSIAISGYDSVVDLVQKGDHDDAYNLASATFTYVTHYKDTYRTPGMSKMILLLGLAISGFISPAPAPSQHLAKSSSNSRQPSPHLSPKSTISSSSSSAAIQATTTTTAIPIMVPHHLLTLSSTILQSVLPILLNDLSADLTSIPLPSLTHILSILASSSSSSSQSSETQQAHPHRTLSNLLSDLWSRRALASAAWGIPATLALGRCHVVSRFLVGDSAGAARLAESLTYNCRRVISTSSASSSVSFVEDAAGARGILEEQTVFLTRLYSSIALRYMHQQQGQGQGQSNGGRAGVYLRKSAAVHETALRALVDPEGAAAYGVGNGGGEEESFLEWNGGGSVGGSVINGDITSMMNGGAGGITTVGQAKRHMQLLKLAVQRLGDWPNDFEVYDQLSRSVCERFGGEEEGNEGSSSAALKFEVDGAAQWKVHDFGNGKAESDEDVLDLARWSWDFSGGVAAATTTMA